MRRSDVRRITGAQALALASAVLFGTTGTAQALGPEGADPATVGAARIAVGGALLAVLALRGGWRRRPGVGLVLAGAGVAAYQLCFFAGVERTGVALGTVVALGSAPAFTGLLAAVVRHERPGRVWAVATTLAALGCVLLLLPGGDVGVDPVGVLLALGAGAAYSGYTVASKGALATGWAPTAVMGAAFGIGALLLAPVLLLGDLGWLGEPRGVALAVYLGVVPTALAYVLFARALARLPAATVATLTLAEPLTAAMLGVAVLGERPGLLAGLGGVLVLSGLLVLAAAPRVAAGGPAAPAGVSEVVPGRATPDGGGDLSGDEPLSAHRRARPDR